MANNITYEYHSPHMTKPSPNSINKSQAIRDYAAANPNAKASAIHKALAAKGIRVAPSNIYMILSKSRRKATRARRAAAAASVPVISTITPADAVIACRQLAVQLGGTKHLLALVQALAE